MEPDEMEAESNKYSDRAVIVLPLQGGRFAVFNNQRRLQAIVWGEGLWDAIVATKCEVYTPEPPRGVGINLSDLGL